MTKETGRDLLISSATGYGSEILEEAIEILEMPGIDDLPILDVVEVARSHLEWTIGRFRPAQAAAHS